MSNCGLDVEKMDTTYANSASAHNIHWVKCADCHQHGIPKATKNRVQGSGIRDQKSREQENEGTERRGG
jgi:hypothetical protein